MLILRVYRRAHAIPVCLLYFTAFVDEDGTIEFRDDVYGRDSHMATALADLWASRRPVSAQTQFGEMIAGEFGRLSLPGSNHRLLRSSIVTRALEAVLPDHMEQIA